jgi:hypothetical protein
MEFVIWMKIQDFVGIVQTLRVLLVEMEHVVSKNIMERVLSIVTPVNVEMVFVILQKIPRFAHRIVPPVTAMVFVEKMNII